MKSLLKVLGLLIAARVAVLEVFAVAAVVYGVAQIHVPAAWIVAGVLGLLKAFEMDQSGGNGP